MKDQRFNNNQKDPQLEKMIEMLRPTPPRKPEAVEQGRAKYLAQLDSLTKDQPNLFNVFRLRRNQPMKTKTSTPRFALNAMIAVIMIFAFLFGGTGLTVYAAEASLPGDTLYSVKSAVEQTRLNLTSSAYNHAQLHLGFAQKRLDEISALIQEKRYEKISQTATDFEYQINQAVAAMQKVALEDPAKAGELAAEITRKVSAYAQALSSMLAGLPDDIKGEVEKARMASQIVGSLSESKDNQVEFNGALQTMSADSWTVAGKVVAITAQTEIKGTLNIGDIVKVHALFGTDGSLTAIEIEAALGKVDDNGNANANENSNANDNSNEIGNANDNGNENGDDQGNHNGNANEQENENANGNENANSNDKGNENTNSNDNGNENDHAGNVTFVGTVKAISQQSWLVNDTKVIVNASTVFKDIISVGALVEVKAHLLSDGTLVADEIERVGDSNINGNANDNQNINNSNDHSGSGSNSNDNSNSGSGSGSGSGSNDNGSGSGSGSGSNDNGSGKGNDNNNK